MENTMAMTNEVVILTTKEAVQNLCAAVFKQARIDYFAAQDAIKSGDERDQKAGKIALRRVRREIKDLDWYAEPLEVSPQFILSGIEKAYAAGDLLDESGDRAGDCLVSNHTIGEGLNQVLLLDEETETIRRIVELVSEESDFD